MDSFDFKTVKEIVFSREAALNLSEHCQRLGIKRPLFVTDPGLVRIGLVSPIFEQLNSAKLSPKIFDQVKDKCNKIHPDLPKLIEGNLLDVEKYWPNNLPTGIIHADLFSDNIFFKNNKFSGFIDFYFSCNDFYAFEIAICFNALCFDGVKENLSFNVTKAKKFIEGYNEVRKISDEERKSIKVLSLGAALRFLLTRVFDYINIVDGAVVKIKDPIEYLKRLEFHKNAKSFEDYLI